MKIRKKIKSRDFASIAVRAVIIVVCLICGRFAAAAPQSVASVLAREGDCFLQRASSKTRAIENTPLFARDMVFTSSQARATILFSDGSEVYLNHDSEVTLLDPIASIANKAPLFKLDRGEAFVRSRPDHIIAAPAALVAVRGTEFLLSVAADGETTIRVATGNVDFFNSYGAVRISAGQMSDASVGSAPTPPVIIPAGELTYEWTFSIDRVQIDREQRFTPDSPDRLRADLAGVRASDASSAANRLRIGDILSDAGRYDDAAAAYSAAYAQAPAATTALRLGYAYLHLNRLDEADAAFDLAARLPAATVARAWTALRERKFQQAAALATPDASQPDSLGDEANLVCGIARSLADVKQRASGEKTLKDLADRASGPFAAQAAAWLAFDLADDGEELAAAAWARRAVDRDPGSAVAHTALAVAYFGRNQIGDAGREANTALALNPREALSQTIAAQTLLAAGRPRDAARMAARAVAVQRIEPEPYCVLGTADYQLGDYVHAEKELRCALSIAPDYPPALVALANLMRTRGNPYKGEALLRRAASTNPASAVLHEGLARMIYARGDYGGAVAEYRKAIALKPDSATAQAGLARAALDADDVPDALAAGQQAVSLAPDIAQFHSLLGLIYQFAFTRQGAVTYEPRSQNEYREALAIDPKNGLARAQLALQQFNGPSDPNSVSSISTVDLSAVARGESAFIDPQRQQNATEALANTIQATLNDRSTISQIFQGGVNTELTGQTDTYDRQIDAVHRDNAAGGAFQDFVQYRNESLYPATDDHGNDASVFALATATPARGVTLLGSWLHERQDQKFGSTFSPSTQQSTAGDYATGVVGLHLTDDTNVYGAVDGLFTSENYNDPSTNIDREQASTGSVATEARLDTTLGAVNVTIGGASGPQQINENDLVYLLPLPGFPPTAEGRADTLHDQEAYVQVLQRVNRRLSYVAAVKNIWVNATGMGSASTVAPAAQVQYEFGRRLEARLIAGRQVSAATVDALEPRDTLQSVEPLALPQGLASESDIYEADIERYFGADLVKIYGFQTISRGLAFDEADSLTSVSTTLIASRVMRRGAGLRLEHAFSRYLYGSVDACGSATNNDSLSAGFTSGNSGGGLLNGRLPYNPEQSATVDLTYVDNHRTTISAELSYAGETWNQQSEVANNLQAASLGWYSPVAVADLRIAREPTTHTTVFLQIDNAFSSRQIQYNDLPAGLRAIEAGAALRF